MSQYSYTPTGTFPHTSGLKRIVSSIILCAFFLVQQPVHASTWNPTALVNTESMQAIGDVDGVSNVVLKFGDVLAKTLSYNRTNARFEFNDNVYANGNLSTSGTMSGSMVHAEKSLTSSGTLVFEGAASGSSLYLGTSLSGAGLGSCSNTTTSKLLYNSTTGRFSCGTDQTGGGGGGGIDQTSADARYVLKQGDTMTGSLVVNGNLTFGDALTDAVIVNAAVWTFANPTNFALSSNTNALTFDTNLLTIDALTKRVGINTIAPKARFDVVGTISGSLLRASNLTVSGAVLYASGSSIRENAKGLSGQLLIAQGTNAPKWANPVGGMAWFLDGTQVTGASLGASVIMPISITLLSTSLVIKGAPTGTALVVDIKKNGTSIYSTKPQINSGATIGGSSAVFSGAILPENSMMTLDVTQVGSIFAGSGLTVMLKGIRNY
jgi:hypothetical protein